MKPHCVCIFYFPPYFAEAHSGVPKDFKWGCSKRKLTTELIEDIEPLQKNEPLTIVYVHSPMEASSINSRGARAWGRTGAKVCFLCCLLMQGICHAREKPGNPSPHQKIFQ